MAISVDTPFQLEAGTPVTIASVTEVHIANLSGWTLYIGPVGTTTVENGYPIGPNESRPFSFPSATSFDILSTVTLPAGVVRVARLS